MHQDTYCFGFDPGLKGAVSAIALDIKKSRVANLPYRYWERPVIDDSPFAFNKEGRRQDKNPTTLKKMNATRGKNRKLSIGWGRSILDFAELRSWLDLEADAWGKLSFLEDPKAVHLKSYQGTLSSGCSLALINEAARSATGFDTERVEPATWQSNPKILSVGRVDWEHGAKDKKEAKKHYMMAIANELFSLDLDFKKAGADGLADALLIGFDGALRYPPVVKLPPVLAWFVLHSEKARTMPVPSNLPFDKFLIYSSNFLDCKEENRQWAKNLVQAYSVEPPRNEDLPVGISGYVETNGIVLPYGEDWDEWGQLVMSHIVYPRPVAFEMNGMVLKPYRNQLPHKI